MSLFKSSTILLNKTQRQIRSMISEQTPVYLSPVRRIEHVATRKRICAITFEDGPCRLPANPDSFDKKPLTQVLAETLERYDAKGTFLLIGSTEENYPDKPGAHGTAAWCGTTYDHYPDFNRDDQGGISNCPELVARLLDGGHEIANHSYSHVPFGRKLFDFNRRRFLPNADAVMDDLLRFHCSIWENWDLKPHFACPPGNTDRISGGISVYNAYAVLGYQYLSASFDGGGRYSLDSYEAEVEDMSNRIKQRLADDPDYFCGRIISLKDGYNTSRRSPIADGLANQLEILRSYGYRIVTASELVNHSSFCDEMPESEIGIAARKLLDYGWCIAYRDNSIRADRILTRGDLAMIGYGWASGGESWTLLKGKVSPFKDTSYRHPYAAAAKLAVEAGAISAPDGQFFPDDTARGFDIAQFLSCTLGVSPSPCPSVGMTHGEFFLMAADLLDRMTD